MKKRDNNSIGIFGATNALKVLSYLAEHSGKEFLNSEIQKATLASRAGVYFALKELVRQNLVSEERRGRLIFYSIIHDDCAIKQFKILKNVLILRHLVLKLKISARKIILYGSYSRGENDSFSDIDLFIVSKDPGMTKGLLSAIKSKHKIQAVIKTASELDSFKESEKVFMLEVERGIVLWKEKG